MQYFATRKEIALKGSIIVSIGGKSDERFKGVHTGQCDFKNPEELPALLLPWCQ